VTIFRYFDLITVVIHKIMHFGCYIVTDKLHSTG